MKASELRIGNLINYRIVDKMDERQEWFEVSEIDYDSLRILGIKDEINQDYQPIPLTEKWLLNFGFVLYLKLVYIFKHHARIRITKQFELLLDGNLWIKLESVHQLQNLYFALTNEELTIK